MSEKTIESVVVLSEKVDNKERKFGSNQYYYPAFMKKDADAEAVPVLFTENELRIAAERAARNPEDTAPLTEEGEEGFFASLGKLFS